MRRVEARIPGFPEVEGRHIRNNASLRRTCKGEGYSHKKKKIYVLGVGNA